MLELKIEEVTFKGNCRDILHLANIIQIYLEKDLKLTAKEAYEFLRQVIEKQSNFQIAFEAWKKCRGFFQTPKTITFIVIEEICEDKFFAREYDSPEWRIVEDRSKDYAETRRCVLGEDNVFYMIPAGVDIEDKKILVVQYDQVIYAI